jgi:LacI family transcriptional regulator
MATMADVARQANVSISTVSHVINGTRLVSPETRQTVLAAIQETGYIRNTIARSLVTASTQTVGLAISGISNFYFANIIAAIEQEMGSAGYKLLLTETHDDPKQEFAMVEALHQRRVDGLFLAPSMGRDNPTLHHLRRLGVPTVLVDRFASDEFDQVGSENRRSTASLVQHLAELGHQRIGMISGISGICTTEERVQGYLDALQVGRLTFDPALIQCGQSHADPAEEVVYQLLTLKDPPTALVVANNYMAIGALRALRRRKVKIPNDIAFVSFDDFEWAELMHPRLTTIAQPIERMGAEAARLMLGRIADPKQEPRTVRLEPTFMHRESCGCIDAY